MKLRTQFILMVISISIVPLVATGAFSLLESLNTARSYQAPSSQQLGDWIRSNSIGGSSTRYPDFLAASQRLEDFMARRPAGSEIVLLDRNQSVLFSSIPEFVTGMKIDDNFLISYIDRNIGAMHFQFEKPQDISGTELLLLMSTPRKTDPIDASLKRYFTWIIMLGLILVSTLISLSMLRSLTKSITKLEQATRRMSSGEMDGDIPLEGPQEIISLTRSFNTMRETLRDEFSRRTRFIMGLSHDLKTPLTLIKGYVEAIQDGFYPDQAQQSTALNLIHDKTAQLEEMLSDLINLVKMDTTLWRQGLSARDIAGLVNEICQQYTVDAPIFHRHFTCDCRLPPVLPVLMDPVLVRHALENLLDNAFRYTGPDGTISLKAGIAERTRILEIRISDDGPGIPAEDQARIFDMFFRGNASRQGAGHGLGLAMVKSVMDNHGWLLAVHSTPQTGSCFTLSIPL